MYQDIVKWKFILSPVLLGVPPTDVPRESEQEMLSMCLADERVKHWYTDSEHGIDAESWADWESNHWCTKKANSSAVSWTDWRSDHWCAKKEWTGNPC